MSTHYGILGFGPKTGLSLLRYFHKKNLGPIDIYDSKDKQEVIHMIEEATLDQDPRYIFSDDPQSCSKQLNHLIISPGVALDHPFIKEAKKKGVVVQTELDFSFSKLDIPILAITGSLGKSTLAKLCMDLLSCRFQKVFVGGNYGTALIEAVEKPYDYAVVEVSSFQLEASKIFHPNVSVFLNLYENHLDRHGSMEHYRAAKMKIFQNQTEEDFAIVNLDQMITPPGAKAIQTRTFSSSGNSKADAYFYQGDMYMDGHKQEIQKNNIPTDQALCALLIADIYKIDPKHIENVFSNFLVLKHRHELISKNGYLFINDSKSTTPDSTLFAISQYRQPIHLIVCGQNKNISVDRFVDQLQEHENIVSITLFGQMGKTLYAKIQHPNKVLTENLEQALQQIVTILKKDDCVLFSPGFASFDQYKNMEERGNHFKKLISGLHI